MRVQGREVCRGARRDWKHEAKVERVGMVIIVDPADWPLQWNIWWVQEFRSGFCDIRATLAMTLGLLLSFNIWVGD